MMISGPRYHAVRWAALLAGLCLCGCASPLVKAVRENNAQEIDRALAAGADINEQGYLRPLHLAIKLGSTEAAKRLIEKGADINSRTQQGLTPLTYALLYSRMDIAKLLVDKGAETDIAMDYFQRRNPVRRAVVYLQQVERQRAGPAAQDVRPQAPSIVSDVDKPLYHRPERPSDFAVVIGIGKYSDLPEAEFAVRDAEAVREHLLAIGFPVRNVVFLTGEKAGYKGIEKFVETWLPNSVDEGSRVFFYFSGHGAPDPRTGQAYLLPYDGDPGFLDNTGYPLQRLYDKLGALKAKEVVVAMDACFSGAGGRSVLAKGARPLVTQAQAANLPENLTVFAAASGDQITSTLEDQGHGTFTYYFLKGLSGEAKDASGAVTAKSLYGYLKPKVQDAARRQNRSQEPVLRGGDRELVRF